MLKRNQKGFTLIELLVTITIIGVMASMIMVNLNRARLKSRDARRIGDLSLIQLSLSMYFDDHPLDGYPGAWGLNQWDILKTALRPYVSSTPSDPGRGAYQYWVSSDHQKYILKAVLEDTEHSALEDDIDGWPFGQGKVSCDDPGYCIGFY